MPEEILFVRGTAEPPQRMRVEGGELKLVSKHTCEYPERQKPALEGKGLIGRSKHLFVAFTQKRYRAGVGNGSSAAEGSREM